MSGSVSIPVNGTATIQLAFVSSGQPVTPPAGGVINVTSGGRQAVVTATLGADQQTITMTALRPGTAAVTYMNPSTTPVQVSLPVLVANPTTVSFNLASWSVV